MRCAALQDLCKLFDGFDAELAAERQEAAAAADAAAHVDAAGLAEARASLPPLMVD